MPNEMKFKEYVEGTDLAGIWDISYKIDGVQVLIVGQLAFSKTHKALRVVCEWLTTNKLDDGLYEYFAGSWNESISHVKNIRRLADIKKENFYLIQPNIDSRLLISRHYEPKADVLKSIFDDAREQGYEGLVLCNSVTEQYIKYKPEYTLDVKVLAWKYGTKRNAARIGAILTEKGWVSAGLTDNARETLMDDASFIGSIIEVSCTELTKKGRMRHARFIRWRPDKDEREDE